MINPPKRKHGFTVRILVFIPLAGGALGLWISGLTHVANGDFKQTILCGLAGLALALIGHHVKSHE